MDRLTGKGLFLVALGCPKNIVDTEVMAGGLLSAGCVLSFDPENADIYLINTCAFLPEAREEAYSAIAEGCDWKQRRSGRILIVSGCLTEYDRRSPVRERFPQVDFWTGVDDIPHLAELLNRPAAAPARRKPEQEPVYLGDHTLPRLQLTLPHVAYLKIADGCDNRCTYCAIPGLRGALRSRSAASVISEAADLIAAGVRELVLVAQDITAFGTEENGSGDLTGLLEELNGLDGDFKIRLLYTHPAHYNEKFIDFMSRADTKVIPYLDIPLQHISDRILAAMHRHVSKAEIISLLAELRRRIHGLTLRTTFITGFPGESENEFAELADFVRKQRFERCGVFAYSAEAGTPAAALPDQVPAETAERRAAEIMRIQRRIMAAVNRGQIGRELPVLLDAAGDGSGIARGPMDSPDIDTCIRIRGVPLRCGCGDEINIRITAAAADGFSAEYIRPKRKRG